MEKKLLVPPFTLEIALQKVQLAEDAWNSKDPERICLAYTVDTEWRNRTEFINGREAVKQFLKGKWEKNLTTNSKKNYGAFVKTEWPCALNTNGMITQTNGIAATEMKCGSSMNMG